MPGLNRGEMELAKRLQALRLAWEATGDVWQDVARRDFAESFIDVFLDDGATTVSAMESLSELLQEAIRSCS